MSVNCGIWFISQLILLEGTFLHTSAFTAICNSFLITTWIFNIFVDAFKFVSQLPHFSLFLTLTDKCKALLSVEYFPFRNHRPT